MDLGCSVACIKQQALIPLITCGFCTFDDGVSVVTFSRSCTVVDLGFFLHRTSSEKSQSSHCGCRPDVTSAVDWPLNANCLSIYIVGTHTLQSRISVDLFCTSWVHRHPCFTKKDFCRPVLYTVGTQAPMLYKEGFL